jgi:hypothetical protein
MMNESEGKDSLVEEILTDGEIKLQGQFVMGNNYTFLVTVTRNKETIQAVYKPSRGEQPLYDFPKESLSRREVAAYQVSEALGWNLVPVTVLKNEGPFGEGSLQFFIEHDPDKHYFNFNDDLLAKLKPVAVFDLLINNADRKGGHILVDAQEKIWLIDHGLCFHEEEKLRTVIWDFAGEPIPTELWEGLNKFISNLKEEGALFKRLAALINLQELNALQLRAEHLLAEGCFPSPPTDRRAFPFPPV